MACCNEFGFVNNTRFYQDGADLNRQFPGKPDGMWEACCVYAHMFAAMHGADAYPCIGTEAR